MWLYALFLISLLIEGDCDDSGKRCLEKEKSLGILDFAKESIDKAKHLYPNCSDDDSSTNTSSCGKREKSLAFLEIASNFISVAKQNIPTCPKEEPSKIPEKPIDCSDILDKGQKTSGVYKIWPRSRIFRNYSVDVFCDMKTDGGGWTVIQRRGNFSERQDFYLDWQSYKNGFGNIEREFWIGNDNIFALSNQGQYMARFDLEDVQKNKRFAAYSTFWIDNEQTNYTLHIKDYSGNANDAMSYHNGKMFSTKDRQNEEDVGCFKKYHSAWWFHGCGYVNLNGLYNPGEKGSKNIFWLQWKKFECLHSVEIKIRRKDASAPSF